MHAIGAAGQRHVNPIVDEQRHPERPKPGLERPRTFDEGARSEGFFAQLNAGDAAPHRGFDHRQNAARAAQGAVGYKVQAQGLQGQIAGLAVIHAHAPPSAGA